MDDIVPIVKKNGSGKIFAQFRALVSEKIKKGQGRVGIFSHPSPDPDALGSQMGLCWLLKKIYEVDVDMFISGEISHPQNLTMEKLLGPKLIPIEDYDAKLYDATFLVDTLPSNCGKRKDIKFDVVIDHHVEMPIVNGDNYLFINLHSGSCCATIYSLIKDYGATFEEDVDYDQQVATALMVGIYTDTCGMLGDRFTDYDHDAYGELFMYRDAESLKEIAKYKRPRSWITLKAKATNSTVIENGVAVVGIGNISLKNRDIVSDLAQEILMWEGVSTSVVFALVDGESLHGSVRSACPSISAAKLSKTLGTDKGGIGWGHADAAGYRYAISGFSFGEEEDESMKNEIWELLNKRELSHVLKIIKA